MWWRKYAALGSRAAVTQHSMYFFVTCSKPGAGALVRLARPRRREKERHALMGQHRLRPSSGSVKPSRSRVVSSVHSTNDAAISSPMAMVSR